MILDDSASHELFSNSLSGLAWARDAALTATRRVGQAKANDALSRSWVQVLGPTVTVGEYSHLEAATPSLVGFGSTDDGFGATV